MGEEKEMEKVSTFSLQSTKIEQSVFDEPRFKVEVLDEGYAWIQKTQSFAKVSCGRFWKSKASGSKNVRETSLGRCSRFKK